MELKICESCIFYDKNLTGEDKCSNSHYCFDGEFFESIEEQKFRLTPAALLSQSIKEFGLQEFPNMIIGDAIYKRFMDLMEKNGYVQRTSDE